MPAQSGRDSAQGMLKNFADHVAALTLTAFTMATETYSLTISYNSAGQFAQNVLHYSFDDSLFSNSTLSAKALIDAFNLHCTGPLKAALSTHTSILSYKSRRISSSGGFESIRVGVVGDIGTRAGDLSASGLAPLIRFVTNEVPPVSGRMFLPGVSDTDCAGGFLAPGFFTVLEGLATALDDPITLVGGGAPVATPVVRRNVPVRASIPIHVAVPSPYLATQRRRQRPA